MLLLRANLLTLVRQAKSGIRRRDTFCHGRVYFSVSSSCSNISVTEISIPVPYGQIALKVWGDERGDPLLAVHGWMDNCGTFDKLIPLLDKSHYVIAVDMPGHGFSSHKPRGCYYSYGDMVCGLKYVVNYFGIPKLNLIGHSMGGSVALFFAAFYPHLVRKFVVLDVIKPISFSTEEMPERFIRALEANMEIESKLTCTPPIYTHDTALERLLQGMHGEITPESGRILLQRGTRMSDCGTGLVFTRDLKLRKLENYYVFSTPVAQEILSRLSSEMLLIRAKNTHPFYRPGETEVHKAFINLYKKYCKHFVTETVEGNHFVHLNNPEQIALLVNKFLS